MKPHEYVTYKIRKIDEIHLFSDNKSEPKPSGTVGVIQGFSAIALLILLIAVINYISLSTATATLRAREISLRKVMGARDWQVRTQFIAESIALSVIATLLALIVANLIAWPVAWYFINDWLATFVYRIDLNLLYFIGAGLLALIIAWATVGSHVFSAARVKPIQALRYE